MCEYQFADLSPLVGALFDQCTIGSEEMLFKETVEIDSRTLALWRVYPEY